MSFYFSKKQRYAAEFTDKKSPFQGTRIFFDFGDRNPHKCQGPKSDSKYYQ